MFALQVSTPGSSSQVCIIMLVADVQAPNRYHFTNNHHADLTACHYHYTHYIQERFGGQQPISFFINSLAPGRCNNTFRNRIFKIIIQNSSLGACCEIALRWIPQNLSWDVNIASANGLVPSGSKSLPDPLLIQILVIRPQWVNGKFAFPQHTNICHQASMS